ncbi:MAG: hypothetical protein ACRDJE_10320 [Dehalococcoidia bacterium]
MRFVLGLLFGLLLGALLAALLAAQASASTEDDLEIHGVSDRPPATPSAVR